MNAENFSENESIASGDTDRVIKPVPQRLFKAKCVILRITVLKSPKFNSQKTTNNIKRSNDGYTSQSIRFHIRGFFPEACVCECLLILLSALFSRQRSSMHRIRAHSHTLIVGQQSFVVCCGNCENI